MMFGCSSSWASVRGEDIHAGLIGELGRLPTAKELCDGLDDASYGRRDPLERIAEINHKRALCALPALETLPMSELADGKLSSLDRVVVLKDAPPDEAPIERRYREIAFDIGITPTKGNRDGPKKGRHIPV